MVRGVFVQIREAQHEFKHPVTLLHIRLIRASFELLHRRERIGEQPLQIFRAQGLTALAVHKRLFGAHGRFVQKVV
ncbi:MAG: hypothetical protein WA823_05120 [Candidatus Acidiferrales bacterium]